MTQEYLPNPLMPEDEEGFRLWVRKEADSIAGWIASCGLPQPYYHAITTTTQDHGGANGTIVYMPWDEPALKDNNIFYKVLLQPNRIYVSEPGRYSIYYNIAIEQGSTDRTTYKTVLSHNGTRVLRGSQYGYSRGSSWGDANVSLTTELSLVKGDYIEVGTEIADTDSVGVSNNIPTECEIIIRKIP